MKSKINAYTLNEMLIVIIISTIIIGMAFTVLTLIQRNMWAIQENLKTNTELSRLEQSLWIDIAKHGKVSFVERDDKLVFKSELDSVVYRFSKNFITKSVDTFHVQIDEKLFYFNGNKTSDFKVDAFRLELPKVYGDQHLFFFKRNDAIQFMD
ncbi:hypothetical protein [Psychroserpens sp. SPM9]|uniref:hypothetical protein n=1 Tax=Psychroserpens sp. SPM9 TaxID=2975598 RepID=UPI0021A6CAD0|nr:hypothetical protein [Psychroserpens sp. SPM9]MDG5490650.1 hypothetical protein [Psychroserpens sp. SPM9]